MLGLPVNKVGKNYADDSEGRWVTLHGRPVFVDGEGNVLKGPKELLGQSARGSPKKSKLPKEGLYGENSDSYLETVSRQDLTPEHKKAIDDWIDNGWQDVQGDANNGKSTPTIKALDEAIAAAPPISKDLLLFRGLEFDPGSDMGSKVAKLKPGNHLSSKGYSSTSTNLDHAEVFTQIGRGGEKAMLRINALGKTRGLAIAESGQDEILLPRNIRMRVVKNHIVNGIRTIDLEVP